MMLLQIEKIGEGLHPSELVVNVHTRSGAEELIIDPESLHGDALVMASWQGRSISSRRITASDFRRSPASLGQR
jgi:hypothetical protein